MAGLPQDRKRRHGDAVLINDRHTLLAIIADSDVANAQAAPVMVAVIMTMAVARVVAIATMVAVAVAGIVAVVMAMMMATAVVLVTRAIAGDLADDQRIEADYLQPSYRIARIESLDNDRTALDIRHRLRVLLWIVAAKHVDSNIEPGYLNIGIVIIGEANFSHMDAWWASYRISGVVNQENVLIYPRGQGFLEKDVAWRADCVSQRHTVPVRPSHELGVRRRNAHRHWARHLSGLILRGAGLRRTLIVIGLGKRRRGWRASLRVLKPESWHRKHRSPN